MGLGQLGKQLAQQVVGEKMKDVMDSLRPPDATKILDPVKQERPATPAPGENLGSAILGQIQAMQRACKEDQELVVLCNAGLETLRVLEFFAPAAQLLVMTGIDTDHNVTRVDLARRGRAAGVQGDERPGGRETGAGQLYQSQAEVVMLLALLNREIDLRGLGRSPRLTRNGRAVKAAMPAAGGSRIFPG